MADDYYAQIAAAAASGGGNYINDGVYRLIIEKMFRKDAPIAAGGGTSFITEFRVVESGQDPNHPEVKPNPVGTVCSVVAVVTKHASAFGNIKALLLGALGAFGYTEDQITPEVIAEAYSTDQLRGVMVDDTTYRKAIKGGKNAGSMITLHKWNSIEQTEEQVAAQKKDLDAGKFSVRKASPAAVSATETTAGTPAAPAQKTSLLGRRP